MTAPIPAARLQDAMTETVTDAIAAGRTVWVTGLAQGTVVRAYGRFRLLMRSIPSSRRSIVFAHIRREQWDAVRAREVLAERLRPKATIHSTGCPCCIGPRAND